MYQTIPNDEGGQSGFTVLEVVIATVVAMIGLLSLAGLFTLSISQNRVVKQFASTTALAQEKIEQLTAIEKADNRLAVGGDLNIAKTVGAIVYSDDIYVDDAGLVYLNGNIPVGVKALYRRFWTVASSAALANTVIIGVRVVALQSGRNTGRAEETVLTTVRSW
jgi:hypothetical protein